MTSALSTAVRSVLVSQPRFEAGGGDLAGGAPAGDLFEDALTDEVYDGSPADAVAVDVSDLPTVDGVASQTETERRIIEVERKRLGLDDQPGPTLAAVT